MYKITYFGHELGDMESVHIAITFESAVAEILIRLGRSKDFNVEASCTAGAFALQVAKQGVIIATVAESNVVCYVGGSGLVQDACSALRQGNGDMVVKLFSPL